MQITFHIIIIIIKLKNVLMNRWENQCWSFLDKLGLNVWFCAIWDEGGGDCQIAPFRADCIQFVFYYILHLSGNPQFILSTPLPPWVSPKEVKKKGERVGVVGVASNISGNAFEEIVPFAPQYRVLMMRKISWGFEFLRFRWRWKRRET